MTSVGQAMGVAVGEGASSLSSFVRDNASPARALDANTLESGRDSRRSARRLIEEYRSLARHWVRGERAGLGCLTLRQKKDDSLKLGLRAALDYRSLVSERLAEAQRHAVALVDSEIFRRAFIAVA